jgi:serine/threonine-protein kinase
MRNLDQEELPAAVPPEGARPPVRALWEQWRQQGCPDFEAFVAAGGRLTADQALAVLRLDQHQRWRNGERTPAESYLGRYRLLREDADAGLLLVYSEFALRQELGEGPALAEYLGRFPHYADGLRQHHALHAALAAAQPTVQAARPVSSGGGPEPAEPGPAGPGGPAIPGYEILGELGRGGMGVVYQARHIALGRLVALKMILAGGHAGEQDLRRFRAEAEAVARLQHPNIVQIFEVGEQDGLPYFSLEFCAGGSLAGQLDGTPLPPRQAAQLVETLARAMHAAHRAGVVHRDLKPANVLLAADGTPKVSDFGLAKRLDAAAGQTASGAIMGTPSYMAPEQAGGRSKQLGPAADVYALGAILYECLTGRPPFKAATPLDTVLQVLGDEPVPPRRLQPKTPRDLDTVCLKYLQKEPRQRYASALALAEDLRRFHEGRPVVARPTGAAGRTWRWCRRKPGLTGAAACALLALGIAGLFAVQAHLADRQRRTQQEAYEGQLRGEKRQYAEERALLAAMSGDADGAAQAIGEAESLGASPGQMHLLRGQVALHRGDAAAARGHLEQAVERMPDSVAARAMLALAYYHAGQGGYFEQAARELDRLTPRTPEDFLFKGQVESFTHPEQGLQTLDEAIRRRDSLIARSVRLEARANHALFTDEVGVAERALDDAHVAKAMLPGNAVTLARSVHAHLVAAGVFAARGRPERSRAAVEQAGRDARALESFPAVPPALVARFHYYDYVGDEETALAVSRLGIEPRLVVMLYRRGDYAKALEAADRGVARGTGLSRVERAFILADLPDGPRRAAAVFEETAARDDLGFWRLCPPMILLLLGRGTEAVQAGRKIRSDPALIPPWYQGWYHRYLDCQCGLITEDELIQPAGTCRPKRCEAHFLIGLRHLSAGDRAGARAHFRQCAETRVFIYWDYQWARAFLRRLEQDPTWPPWIPVKD